MRTMMRERMVSSTPSAMNKAAAMMQSATSVGTERLGSTRS